MTFPLSVLVDPMKIEELFQKIESRKKLEQMLMDPRVIELSRQSPSSKQALAAVVRRLQDERARKRRIKNAEQKEDLEPVPKWFNCISFLKSLSVPPRQNTRQSLKSPQPTARQKQKQTRSTPNLESTTLPTIVSGESSALVMSTQSLNKTTIAEMAVCIPGFSKDGSLPLNLMEFCTSEKGRLMISSLINSTDIRQLFGLQPLLPTQRHRLLQCVDCLNLSDLHCVQYYVPLKSICQRYIILRCHSSRNSSFPKLTFDEWNQLKNVMSSATQTVLSASCSRCSSYCISTESFSSYNNSARNEDIKQNRYELALCTRNNMIKTSKSQSAMYTTDYSECDCDDFSSPDDICGGKYLSRILTHAVVPKVDYLTTPDVLVTYSGNANSSDSETSSGSCKACRGDISSESFHREPREIWTQKRLKTSCESCLNTFRSEYIRKKRYPNDVAKLSGSGSFGSLLSDDTFRGLASDIPEMSENIYINSQSILNAIEEKEKGDLFDSRREIVGKDIAVYKEQTLVIEQNCDETQNKSLNSDGAILPLIEYEGVDRYVDSNIEIGSVPITEERGDCISVYELPSQSPMIEKNPPCSCIENEPDVTIVEHTETQLDGGTDKPINDGSDLQSATVQRNMLIDDTFSTGSSGDDSTLSGSIVSRMRRHRKKVRNNKCSSDLYLSDTSSSSSLPQFRTFPRRLKPKVLPNQNTTPQQNIIQKVPKQKPRKKNCAIM